MEPIPAYCWGQSYDVGFAYAALSGQGIPLPGTKRVPYPIVRPTLDATRWQRIDGAIEGALRACGTNMLVALVPSDAERLARMLYVWAEPGPSVIAIGHEDGSVSYCLDGHIVDANEALLVEMLEKATSAFATKDLEATLLCIAEHLPLLRVPALRGPSEPPPLPELH